MNAVLAMDSRDADPRPRADRLDGRIRDAMAIAERQTGAFPVIGQSPPWRQVLRQAAQVAATDTTVFLQGESGTGKEVVARFIHRASPRRNGPFVAINCAALPEQLLESELFGYERGAFTGAHLSKAGHIEVASSGVLFLDEVSEMSLTAQAKLLRVLQEREFQRLGGTRVVKANVRVIAASNRDLQSAVTEGRFREDLFYRLRVFDIYIPPLRERRGDIPLLIDAFLQGFSRSTGCSSAGLTPDAQDMLLQYSGPATSASSTTRSSGRPSCVRVGLSRLNISPFAVPASPHPGAGTSFLTSNGAPSSRPYTRLRGTNRRPHAG